LVDVDSLLIAGAVSAIVSFTILFLKEFWIEPRRVTREAHRQWLQDQLRLVYGPLYSAIISMKAGRKALPAGYTLGTPINIWNEYENSPTRQANPNNTYYDNSYTNT